MQSFGKRQRCLFAVVLAAGGSAAFLELQPASGISPQASLAGPPLVASREITALSPDFSTLVQIYENGDGTAFTAVITFLEPTVVLGVLTFENTDYTISADFEPGQSGQGAGSGTGHFELQGVFALDLITFMPVGPFDVSVDIAVADATTVAASMSQGVTTQFNPSTGETSIVRQHIIGNQAYGDTAGSLSVFVDDGGGFVPATATTGGWGMVTVNTVHNVEQIH